MNEAIRKRVPAAILPAEIREGIDASHLVEVTVTDLGVRSTADIDALHAELLEAVERARGEPFDLQGIRERLKPPGLEPGESVARIRALRDEWDD